MHVIKFFLTVVHLKQLIKLSVNLLSYFNVTHINKISRNSDVNMKCKKKKHTMK